MPFDPYFIFLWIYILNIFYILKEDLDTKYIPLLWFYPFVVMSWIYYHLEFWYIIGTVLIVAYLLGILALDIYEYKKWPIANIGEGWRFLDTGIYDYFLYIFIGAIVVSEIVHNFWTIWFIFDFFTVFITTAIIWGIFLKIHKKKVKMLVSREQITDYDSLDQALFERKLQKIKFKDIIKKEIILSQKSQEVYDDYSYRVPLFLFGNTFILAFILIQYV